MSLERRKNNIIPHMIIIVLIILIIIGGIIWWIMRSIEEYYPQDDPKLRQLKEMLKPLHPAVKDLKLYKGDKSYTINKEKIFLCLVDEKGQYYSDNMLIYVLLHELSHLLNKDDVGHTEKFNKIFQDLIDKAHELGVYNSSIPPIENYCMYK